MQQLRYFQKIGRDRYPTKAFCNDISDYLKESMESGFEIVLSLEGNENMRCRRIAKALLNLGLSETSQLFSDEVAPAIFYIGKNQLDAV